MQNMVDQNSARTREKKGISTRAEHSDWREIEWVYARHGLHAVYIGEQLGFRCYRVAERGGDQDPTAVVESDFN